MGEKSSSLIGVRMEVVCSDVLCVAQPTKQIASFGEENQILFRSLAVPTFISQLHVTRY